MPIDAILWTFASELNDNFISFFFFFFPRLRNHSYVCANLFYSDNNTNVSRVSLQCSNLPLQIFLLSWKEGICMGVLPKPQGSYCNVYSFVN